MKIGHLALERHVIIEEFSQIEGFLDLIIFAVYAYGDLEEFIQDLLMSNMSGFGLKMQILKKLKVDEKIVSKKEMKFLKEELYKMSDIRNYVAHTTLSRSKVIDGKRLHLRTRNVDTYEKTLEEITKPFHESESKVIAILSTLCEYYNNQSLLRLKERMSAEFDSDETAT